MRFLAVVLAAVAVLGVGTVGRTLFDRRSSLVDVQPRLLQVAQGARGVVTLGDGLTVSMYAAGLRVQRQDQVAFETVVQGSLVSAARGHLRGSGRRPPGAPRRHPRQRADRQRRGLGARRDLPGCGVRRRAALAAADPDRQPGGAAGRPAGHGAGRRPGRPARRAAAADRGHPAAAARSQPARTGLVGRPADRPRPAGVHDAPRLHGGDRRRRAHRRGPAAGPAQRNTRVGPDVAPVGPARTARARIARSDA